MKFEWFVARRYFNSNRKDSSFLSFIKIMAIAGVAIGTAGLLIALSIVHGFRNVIEEKILDFGAHIAIEAYSDMPLFRADTLVSWLNKHPDIDEAQAVTYGQGMLQTGQRVEGSFIKGVPIEGDLSNIRNYVTFGEYNLAHVQNNRYGIVMGAAMARNLGAEIGDVVSVFSIRGVPSAANLPEIQQFILTGVYQTGIDRFDDVFALIDINRARNLFGLQAPAASFIDIRVHDIASIYTVSASLRDELEFPYHVQSIYQRYSNIFAWVNLQEQTIPLVIGVMIIVAAFNLIGTVLMMVLERVRDIGILKIIGTRDAQIRKIFLIEGFLVGLIGLLFGISIAAGFNFLQAEFAIIPLSEENYYMSTAPVAPRLSDYFVVSGITLALCLMASLLPARVASRLNALSVTRFGK
jgi:lipoprotein-releasing system permease protein